MVKHNQRLVGQRHEELNRKERVAACLFVNQLSKWVDALWRTMQGIHQQLIDVAGRKRPEGNLLRCHPCFSQLFQHTN